MMGHYWRVGSQRAQRTSKRENVKGPIAVAVDQGQLAIRHSEESTMTTGGEPLQSSLLLFVV